MKLATWNVARPVPSAARRRTLVIDQIRLVAADVWVLTETHDSVVPGSEFGAVSTRGSDRHGDPCERWSTIWSRFPIEPLSPTSDPIRAVAARVVPPAGPPLIVYGTVLPWLGSRWRSYSAADGLAFAQALEAQAADWRTLRESNPDHDLVVAGDFNQDLAHTHYYGSRANRRRLLLALDGAGLVALTAGDGDPIRRDSSPRACIDHVCISKSTRWLLNRGSRWPNLPKPDRRMSDHFGVAVEFMLANSKMEPTRLTVRAIMALRRAAHFER